MNQRSLKLSDIVFFNFVAVISLRWLASAAATGPSSLTLWVLAALFFFLPQGLAVAALSSAHPAEGGLYQWTKASFGEWHGFICGWCYWVNNLLYFPSLLLYVSANLAFALQALHPEWQLEHSTRFVVLVTIGTLWLVSGISIAGLRLSKWIQNAGGLANWIPALAVVILGGVALYLYGSANPINLKTITPRLGDFAQLSYFAQLCFALAGLELVSFFQGNVKNPGRTIPLAIVISGICIVLVYSVGTLGILVSVPQDKITLVNGLLLPVQQMGEKLQVPWLATVSGILIALAGLGATLAWFSGAARIPYLVGVDRYLPRSFGRLHPKLGTPVTAILVQTLIATLLTIFATLGAETKVEVIYKILVDMCLILYFIPYCYLFLSLPRLCGAKHRLTGFVGFATTVLAIATTALPNGAQIDWLSLSKTILGTLAMLGVGGAIYALAGRKAAVSAR